MILLILNTLAQNLVQKKYVKKRPRRAASWGFLAVLLIPFSAAHAPVPLEHGLAAVRFVLLSDEGLLVSRDLRQVMTALSDHRPNADKAVADLVLTLRQRSRALVRISFLDVDTLALRVGRRRGSVRHDDVVAVFVTVLFLGFLQGALDVLDSSGADSCSCHISGSLIDHAIHGFYRHNRNDSHIFFILV